MNSLAPIACMLLCISVIVLGLAIPSIIFGFADEDATCQEGTRGGLNLSDWLKGYGLEKVIVIGLLWTFFGLSMVNEIFAFGAMGVVVCEVFFVVIWFVWGIVILATSENNKCVAEGKSMAVMAIIDLVLGGSSLSMIKVTVNSD